MTPSGNHDAPLHSNITKTKIGMEVISIERSTYEELLTSVNSFVTKMKEMVSRDTDKGLRIRNLTPSPILTNLLVVPN